MTTKLYPLLLVLGFLATSFAFTGTFSRGRSMTIKAISQGKAVPSGIKVDVITPADINPGSSGCAITEVEDFGKLLQGHKKAVLFAVPGAFTPTCSAQHLPGFIEKIHLLKAKGVDAVYCLSVNDKHVMRAWAENTKGCRESGINLIADGNGEYTSALGLAKDASGSRMGTRSMRYAAVIEGGVVKALNVDEKGMEKSSVDSILAVL